MKDIILALREKYQQPEWELLFELRNGTGSTFENSIDAFVINTYPSKDFHRIAFEIKHSRNDFMNEIKNPDKRKFAMSISNEFYFLCSYNFISKDEIPEQCGLMVMENMGIRIKKIAQQREIDKAIPIKTVCSLIRNMMPKEPVLNRRYATRLGDKSLIDIDKIVDEDIAKRVEDRNNYSIQRKIDEKYEEQHKEFVERKELLDGFFIGHYRNENDYKVLLQRFKVFLSIDYDIKMLLQNMGTLTEKLKGLKGEL